MKKTVAILAGFVLAAGVALAALDVYDTVTTKVISNTKLANLTQTNTAVDVYDCKGTANLLIFMGPSVTNSTTSVYTNSATLYTSTASASGYYPVTNGAGTLVQATTSATNGTGSNWCFKVEASCLKRYVKLITVAPEPSMIGADLLYCK